MHMGPTGLEDTWLWYDTEGRPDELVKTKSCDVAEVLWEGYKCWNGRVETSKVRTYFTVKNIQNVSDGHAFPSFKRWGKKFGLLA